MTIQPSPRVFPTPPIVVVDSFVIETYQHISNVPYASVPDLRGPPPKTSEQERPNELYGRCRTCLGRKAGEQLLLCDDCDRGFHMTCLHPAIRDIPKGEWHCPKCTRDRNYTYHLRATAVVELRNILKEIEVLPTMPLKLRMKALGMPPISVQFSRVPTCASSPVSGAAGTGISPKTCLPSVVPPKRRLRINRKEDSDADGVKETVIFKKVVMDTVRRRREHIRNVARDIAEVAKEKGRYDLVATLKEVEDTLLRTGCERKGEEPGETRTSHNSGAGGRRREREGNVSSWVGARKKFKRSSVSRLDSGRRDGGGGADRGYAGDREDEDEINTGGSKFRR